MNNLQQIRFTDGLEVIANIMTWEEDTMIEANYILIMEILTDYQEDPTEDRSFYILKPMVSYIDDLSKTSIINPSAVISVTEPAEVVIKQYKNSITEIQDQMTEIIKADKERGGDSVSNVIAFAPKSPPEFLVE
jgi:hypothetical protein